MSCLLFVRIYEFVLGTLLNILNSRNIGQLQIQGNIKINGKQLNSLDAMSAISGYVQQKDLFVGTLKVKEHLFFQVNQSF